MRTDVLGVGFDDVTLQEAIDIGISLLEGDKPSYVVTPNPELVSMARKSDQYRNILNSADLVLPDGIGVVHAAKILKTPLKGRCPGIEFGEGLVQRMAGTGKGLYLLGAKPGVAQRAADNLKEKYPELNICGTGDGYFTDDAPVIEDIKGCGADVVFVCLGAPKQEEWMVRNMEATGARLLVGMGGSLDVFAGEVQRAPEKWQRLGLEWLYRLLKEPSRVGRMARLPLFLLVALRVRIFGK